MPPTHEAIVNRVSAAVKAFYSRHQSFRVFHGSTNSTRPTNEGRSVNISALSNVLEIDKSSRTVLVEPNVPMDKLVQATLAHGLVPPVVMEFPGITVGGGFSGSALESSSFRYGYFDQTVKSIEMVLATGDVVKASESDNADLLRGAAGSAGTLGLTTMLELKLLPAKKYVRIVYHPYSNVKDTIAAVRRETRREKNDYVDGIIFSKSHGVVITGTLTDDAPGTETAQAFSGPWDSWFYMHAQEKSKNGEFVEHQALAEYLFRYDRGAFWVGAEAFRYFRFVPFNRFTRWLLDDFMHTRMLYRALQESNMSFATMVQDLTLPYETAEDFIWYTIQSNGIWPLWLCPLRAIHPPTFHPFHVSNDGTAQPLLNIGLWGKAPHGIDESVRQNRELEARLTELGGRKLLYSHTYYSENEFWRLYDHNWYETLRKKYSATTLPTIYDKVHVDVDKMRQRHQESGLSSVWPLPGLFGIRSAIRSQDYLIHRKPSWTYWKDVSPRVRGGTA